MSQFSHWPLQKAVFLVLSADTTLQNTVSGVFDFVPDNTIYPYICVGEATGRDYSTATTSGMEFRFPVRLFSREGGRKQAAEMLQRIHSLLHRQPLSVDDQALVMLRCESSEIRLENDGATYQGILRFRAILETA